MGVGTSVSSFNCFIGRCVLNLGTTGFIFNEWEERMSLSSTCAYLEL